MRFVTLGRALLVSAVLASLGGCFDREGRNETEPTNNTAAEENESGGDESPPEDGRRERREADPEVLREIERELDDYRRTLPQRSGPMTITDVELDGSELTYTQRSNANLTSEQVDRLEREVQRNLCRGQPGEWIRRGVTMSYRITDPDGDDYRISVRECPEGSSGRDRERDGGRDGGGFGARGDDSGGRDDPGARDEGSRGGADPELAEEMAREAQTFRASLPRQDGPMTTYDVDVEGVEITYYQRTSLDLNDENFPRLEQGVSRALCQGGTTARAINRGAVMTFRITDRGGEVFRTTVRSC